MVIVDLEDLDLTEMGAIGWILSVLTTVAAKMEIANLLLDIKSQYYGQDVCKNYKNVYWIVNDDCCNKKKTYTYSSIRSKGKTQVQYLRFPI